MVLLFFEPAYCACVCASVCGIEIFTWCLFIPHLPHIDGYTTQTKAQGKSKFESFFATCCHVFCRRAQQERENDCTWEKMALREFVFVFERSTKLRSFSYLAICKNKTAVAYFKALCLQNKQPTNSMDWERDITSDNKTQYKFFAIKKKTKKTWNIFKILNFSCTLVYAIHFANYHQLQKCCQFSKLISKPLKQQATKRVSSSIGCLQYYAWLTKSYCILFAACKYTQIQTESY